MLVTFAFPGQLSVFSSYFILDWFGKIKPFIVS